MELLRKNTHWQVVGTNYQFEITDLWGKGIGDDYKVTAFEIKYKHILQVQTRSAELINELLNQCKIKRI